MAYKVIHTSLGLALLAQAKATGTPINLTEVAVGDGNGNPVTPSEGQTNLVRERFRTQVNTVYQSQDNPTMYIVEAIIPASTGGFVMREVGVFDANGNLFVVGNLPDTTKPTDGDGAFSDTVIQIPFVVNNAAEITLMVDPNVVVSTRQWILNTITVCHLLPGGTTGQILTKKSNACGDAEWKDPTDVNVTVSSIEETQTLAASQTVVDWALVNNTGLAVYIEGVRLRADQWTKHPTINTRITLATTYPVGTKIVGTQNEPAGTLPDPLVKGQNLADVPDKAIGRTNLDVFSKNETRQMAPAGLVAGFARTTAPSGWLKCNGAAVNRVAYSDLFAAIGTIYGAGDGFNTFNLPDFRGEFPRFLDDGRGVDAGRVLGSWQADMIKSHEHDLPTETAIAGNRAVLKDAGFNISTPNNSAPTTGYRAYTYETGGVENRPRNVVLLACIKF
jgi:phage-related tail fiber protein